MNTRQNSSYVDASAVWEIRRTAKAAHARGLLNATKWALDLLRGINPEFRAQPATTPAPPIPEDEELEAEMLNLARLAIDEKQFPRAIVLLDDASSARGLFMRTYCNYIVSEKRALKEWHALDNKRQQPPKPVNNQVAQLYLTVENAIDPWLLFLKALLLFRLQRFEETIDCVLLSLETIPWNWSSWMLLVDCIHDPESLSSLLDRLPVQHAAVQMFMIRMMNALNTFAADDIPTCNRLLSSQMFPNSLWIRAQFAQGLYIIHDYEAADQQFHHILSADPYRIDDLEIYADILYAVENKERLSSLAQFVLILGKNRPETCYLLGCHYSLRAEHEKSARYFRRATELDRTFSPAWTMMGLEYIEMENPQAAIESFRRAVDVNPKDYRAWASMGKAYGALGMPWYALYYTKRALHLRPHEAESWEDLGHIWELAGKPETAIACLKQALESEAPHPLQIYLRLMQLLITVEDFNAATFYAEEAVATGQAQNVPVEQYAKAMMAVAEHQAMRPTGDWGKARDYLEKIVARVGDEAINKRALELLSLLKRSVR
ncbi:TPR-REGION domain-containing protein [Mycena indigotica]|uniref:TPR-REGION domain-containing protein n=1 Tax=Mycena indigotica TaxID=2126181 RepID=A0A8H6W679_9AGAR|nr:TPR-REGION domain-containing protein [Mycena indigotica]KAF7307334.1 TPR-REGION domain-containing protein [Mycena indigotica]